VRRHCIKRRRESASSTTDWRKRERERERGNERVLSDGESGTERGEGAPLRDVEVMEDSPLPTLSRALRSMMVRGSG
jgi:hypothetical protein